MDQMTASDVAKIIKAAAQSGVVELKVGDLEVKFSPYYQPQAKVSYSVAKSEAVEEQLPLKAQQAETIDDDYDLFNDPVRWDEELRGDQGDDEP